MNSQLERWMGNFGNKYTRRSILSPKIIIDRSIAFANILFQLKEVQISVLEVGCNIGGNLLALKPYFPPPGFIIGVEPNEMARRIAQINDCIVFPDCGQKMNFMDRFFDLVFTCGVLIHCELSEAEKIVEEMNRVSKRYLMFMEYYEEQDREIPYREETELLWRRPWSEHFKKWGFDKPISSGFLPPEMGFDNVHWWVYERK